MSPSCLSISFWRLVTWGFWNKLAEVDGSSGDIRSHRRSASASSQPTQMPGVAGKGKFQPSQSTSTAAAPVLDFSESDQFRSRVGSIVKKSSSITVGNGNCNSTLPNQNGMQCTQGPWYWLGRLKLCVSTPHFPLPRNLVLHYSLFTTLWSEILALLFRTL